MAHEIARISGRQWTCSEIGCERPAVMMVNGVLSGAAKHGGGTHGFAVPLHGVVRTYIEHASPNVLKDLAALIEGIQQGKK